MTQMVWIRAALTVLGARQSARMFSQLLRHCLLPTAQIRIANSQMRSLTAWQCCLMTLTMDKLTLALLTVEAAILAILVTAASAVPWTAARLQTAQISAMCAKQQTVQTAVMAAQMCAQIHVSHAQTASASNAPHVLHAQRAQIAYAHQSAQILAQHALHANVTAQGCIRSNAKSLITIRITRTIPITRITAPHHLHRVALTATRIIIAKSIMAKKIRPKKAIRKAIK